jgi:hypothetical protein
MTCDKEVLIVHNIFLIYGCKIKSNASKEWSDALEVLERKQTELYRASQPIIERHQVQHGFTQWNMVLLFHHFAHNIEMLRNSLH